MTQNGAVKKGYTFDTSHNEWRNAEDQFRSYMSQTLGPAFYNPDVSKYKTHHPTVPIATTGRME